MDDAQPSKGVAYLLWALCFVGVSGIHRFYLGKPGTGVLWLVTLGLFGIGNLIDLFTIPSMVAAKTARDGEEPEPGATPAPPATPATPAAPGPAARPERLETAVLQAAAANGGSVTPAAIAVQGHYGLEESKKCLDGLVDGGHAELRVLDDGSTVYAFPDLQMQSALRRSGPEDPATPHG